MIRVNSMIKFIFILLAVLVIVIWFQFFHSRFFSENTVENTVEKKIENKININENINEQDDKEDMAKVQKWLTIGEEMYSRISNFNFKLGDFQVEQGATEVLNIEELKVFVVGNAFDNVLKSNGIESDDTGKYWDIGDRDNDKSYLNHHDVNIKKIDDEKVEYIIAEYYVKNKEDIGKSYQELNKDQIEIQKNKFTIVKDGEEWKISEYTNPK